MKKNVLSKKMTKEVTAKVKAALESGNYNTVDIGLFKKSK